MAKKSSIKAIKRGQTVFLCVMLAIPILQWFVFWLYVNINSILLGFQNTIGGWTLANFQQFFTDLTVEGSTISIAVKNTFIYFFNSLCIIMPLALFISYFLYRQIFGTKFFRIVFYMPGIISAVALTTAYMNFLDPVGPFGIVCEKLGISPIPELFANSEYATTTIVIYCIWTGFGTNILLFSGAMSRIPLEIIESARMDGCTTLTEVFRIVLPLIWPTLSTLIIFQCTGLFSASGPILLFTKGQYDTTTIGYWIFDMVYQYHNYNIVSAAGLVFTCIGVPFILLVRKLVEKVPSAEY